MYQSNSNERAESLQQDCCPLNRAYRRLTDDDTLTPRVRSPVQCSYDLAPGDTLSFVLRLQGHGQMQGFDQGGRQSCEREALMRHRWPFSVHRFVNVATNESAKLHLLLFGEVLIEENDGS